MKRDFKKFNKYNLGCVMIIQRPIYKKIIDESSVKGGPRGVNMWVGPL